MGPNRPTYHTYIDRYKQRIVQHGKVSVGLTKARSSKFQISFKH